MKVIKNDKLILIDCDGTLISWDPILDPEDRVVVECNGDSKVFYPMNKTVENVKTYKMQGFEVIVHSSGGWEWAEAVVKALKLEEYVDHVFSKPKYYVDDEDSSNWMLRIPPKV